MPKAFKDLTEREILGLAISLEEEDGRTYAEFAQRLREPYPATAKMLDEMQAEESEHRSQLIEQFRARFGEHIPLIHRQDVKGFVSRPAWWMVESIGPAAVRKAIESMESETQNFYRAAQAKVTDASTRKLLGELADAEAKHTAAAGEMEKQYFNAEVQIQEDEAHQRAIVLQYIQPGLVGLMDGSVSTLAPVFAAAFATHKSWDAFLVGLAASVGAGISMGFAEALSDDGTLSGRGSPLIRGVVCGAMTTAGGIGHTLPYLIGDFQVATAVAIFVVAIELAVISWVRHRFMQTPLVRAAVQVAVGGILVFVAGVLIGQS
ncbi:MAG TPA: ferritin family protein [Bryobacteraceae bacterium]|jgi:rubrerythrin|nr:ferritin family protein [Bryobacteraceae bacterium]